MFVGGIAWHDGADHAPLGQLIEDTATEKKRVLQRRRREALVHDDDAVPRGVLEHRLDADQLILKLAGQVLEVFRLFEMGE